MSPASLESLTVAAGLLALAVDLHRGEMSPQAFLLLIGASLASALALGLLRSGRGRSENGPRRRFPVLLGAVVAAQFATYLFVVPIQFFPTQQPPPDYPLFGAGLMLAAAVAADSLARGERSRTPRMAVMVGVFLLLGSWVILHTPDPHVDVTLFHRVAGDALLRGMDPYATTIPNIYGPTQSVYTPGLVVDGRVQVGFPYPPLSLLLSLPGQLVAGDYRWALLVAIALTGAVLGLGWPGRASGGAAALVLFTPNTFFAVEKGSTEAFLLLALALLVLAATRWPRLVPYLFGAFVAIKQYALLFLPIAILLVKRQRALRRLVGLWSRALAVAAVVTLPFVVWGVDAFVNSVIVFHLQSPFRVDGLSYLAALALAGGPELPSITGFVTAGVVMLICLWLMPRTAQGFAASVGLVALAFFAFNKQAFGNYYFFTIGALACAAAGGTGDRSPFDTPAPPVAAQVTP